MLPCSYKLRQAPGYSTWLLGLDRALDMTAFVHGVYHQRFQHNPGWDAGAELSAMYDDDRATLMDSTILCAYDDSGRPLCTIKAIRKTPSAALPVERDFAVDMAQLLRARQVDFCDVFEIGRLAKDDQAAARVGLDATTAAKLGGELVTGIVKFTTQSLDNVWVASLDNSVLTLLRSRGFGFEAVGPATFYLGSDTTPVLLPVRKWWLENRKRQRADATVGAPAAPVAASQ